MGLSLRNLSSGEGVIAAEVGQVCVVIWRGAVLPPSFALQCEALAGVVARFPKEAAFLCIVEQTAKPPDAELRRQSAEMITSHGEKLRCVATVIEGGGFKAAIARSVLAGIALLVRNRNTDVDYFPDVTSAANWIGERAPDVLSSSLIRAVAQLRTLLPAAPAPPRSERRVREF